MPKSLSPAFSHVLLVMVPDSRRFVEAARIEAENRNEFWNPLPIFACKNLDRARRFVRRPSAFREVIDS
jgi:hypothetical protein